MKTTMLAVGMAAGLGLSGAAHAALVDFTDPAQFGPGDFSQSYDLGPYSTTASISAIGGPITFEDYDGPVPPSSALAGSGLYAGTNPTQAQDGVGIGGDVSGGTDEITNPDELLTLTFTRPVYVEAFHFLDLYQADVPGAGQEGADVYVDGVLRFSFSFDDEEMFTPTGSGYYFAGVSRFTASSISFGAQFGNDLRAQPDYALAGVEVAPIPLPAAGLMLVAALGGLGAVRRLSASRRA